MAQDSKIEWTKHTANLWHGCTKVQAGCDNCYAEAQSHRWGNDVWGNDKPRKEVKSVWTDLAKFQNMAVEAGEIHRVFVGSMMDIFERRMPLINSKKEPFAIDTGHLRVLLFSKISNGEFPNLDFLFLTKRPSNINKYIPEAWKENPPTNVMFGYSAVDMPTAKNIEMLLQVKGRKFLSIEPMLGELTLTTNYFNLHKGVAEPIIQAIDWVIVGGESGSKRRPFDLAWARSLRDECKASKVPFFFKQIDKVIEKETGIPEDLQIREFPKQNF